MEYGKFPNPGAAEYSHRSSVTFPGREEQHFTDLRMQNYIDVLLYAEMSALRLSLKFV